MAKAKKAGSGGIKLEDLKKHYFWIVLPLIVVLAFVFIFLAKGKIKKQYEEKSTAIESEKSAADTVAGNAKHPNQKTIDAIKAETDVLKQKVFGAWTLMYDDQKNRNHWPRQLSAEFRDLVENKLNFRDPIDPSKPYLLEDYGYFIANHLPNLIKSVNRRRCQVKEYKLLKKNEMDMLGVQGLEERFWPVYVSKDSAGKEFLYVGILSNPDDESSALKDVFLYDIKSDLVQNVSDSALADRLKAGERVPYYRDVDPWIRNPKDMINFGVQTNNLSAIATAVAAAESGAAGGAMGAGGGMMGGSGGMMGGSMGGGAMGGSGGAGGSSSMGGSRGSMGGDGMGGGMGSGGIPGDGYDPAEEQISGTSLEELAGGGTGMGGAGGMRTGGAMAGGGAGMGGSGGMRTGGAGGVGGSGGGMGGVGGANGGMGGATVANDPTWAIAKYPGLPPYKERRRIVGNVDWPNPEIFNLPTWEATAHPTSIEVWYAQETLWVYEALIRVVAETNKEYVDDIANAPVKSVEQMLIGQEAAIQWTTLTQTIGDLTGMAAQSAMGSAMGSMGSSSMMSSPSAGSGSMGMDGGVMLTGSAEMQALTKIVYGRYLDGENKPLLASDAPPFAEFNKMPVCLKVVINQTKIPELLTQCANCSMPIDVKHVRISPDNNVPFSMPIPLENMGGDAAGGGMMGGMGMMGGGMGMMGGSGGMGAMGGSGGAAGGAGAGGARGAMGGSGGMGADGMGGMGGVDIGRSDLSQSEYGADAIRVEIYGVINIFNKPDQDTFGTGEEAKKSDAAADVALTEAGAAENQAAADEKAAAEAAANADSATDGTAENATESAPTTENAPAADASATENASETSTP